MLELKLNPFLLSVGWGSFSVLQAALHCAICVALDVCISVLSRPFHESNYDFCDQNATEVVMLLGHSPAKTCV